ncbi:MAG: hypothetical protein RBR15_13510 [Sphaerochaeta sp.]|nr:hypothetical protein [Sphaerochaeta sp.]
MRDRHHIPFIHKDNPTRLKLKEHFMDYNQSEKKGKMLTKYITLIFFLCLVMVFIGCPIIDQYIALIEVSHSHFKGIAFVGDSIKVVEILPEEAEVSYTWQRSVNEESGFVDISGAITDSYETSGVDAGYFVRVAITGTGEYKGTVYGSAVEVLSTARTINIPEIPSIKAPVVGINPVRNIHAEQYFAQVAWNPNHTPFRARTSYVATIQLSPSYGYTCEGVSEDFFTVEEATSTSNDEDSNTVRATFTQTGSTSLISIGNITGTLEIRKTVSAGTLSPGGATATYQWYISNTQEGIYASIDGATGVNYTIKDEQVDKYLQVEATGAGGYLGKVISAAAGPIKLIPLIRVGNISGTSQVGKALTMGSLSPTGATVTHWWLSSPTIDGKYTEITHAPDNKEFTVTKEELNLFIKGQVEGIGLYEGIKKTAPVGPVITGELESIGNITGKRLINEQLEAGPLKPDGSTASYQWQWSDTEDGTYVNIPGDTAQDSTYVVHDDYWEKYIRVSATGTDGYKGTVLSNPVEIAYSIGDRTDGGGFIFYDKGVRNNSNATKEWRYLEAAPQGWSGSDNDPNYRWDSTNSDPNEPAEPQISVTGLTNSIGSGMENTSIITNALGAKAEAAKACSSYNGSGASDWFLGSCIELSYMMVNKPSGHGLANSFYYSSYEYNASQAYAVDLFGSYFYNKFDKRGFLYVRPIRMR